ncbi:hypothetical protein B484DRAFT_390231, partial [Ochromonadaceae sp. CCMP2298]
MERGDVLDDGGYILKGTRDKSAAVNLIINRFTSTLEASKEPFDVFVGLAARGYLRRYYCMTTIPRSDHVATIWPSANREDMEFFRHVVQRLVFFSQGFPISAVDVQLGIDKADSSVRRQRQHLLRTQ